MDCKLINIYIYILPTTIPLSIYVTDLFNLNLNHPPRKSDMKYEIPLSSINYVSHLIGRIEKCPMSGAHD